MIVMFKIMMLYNGGGTQNARDKLLTDWNK